MTIPEILVSIVILTVGLLGLGASGLYVTGLVARSERVGAAATFAARRLEMLRAGACATGVRAVGSEYLMRGTALVAANSWSIADGGGGTVRIRVATSYQLVGRRARNDTIETAVVCR